METLLPYLAVPEEGAIDVDALFSAASSPLPRGEDASQSEAGEGRADDHAPGRLTAPHPPTPSAPRDRFAIPPLKNSPAAKQPVGRGGVASPLVLEIGFGGGEHLVAQASAHPNTRYIGVEPFLNGVASCLRHVEEANVANVRIHNGDARDVIARLAEASLDLCYILFPDPWPKARHHKRRLIQPDFLSELARVLRPGGELRFATDWANYAEWTLEHVTRDARFSWTAERAEDWRRPWPGHVTTRYEAKKLGDCAPIWLRFVRTGTVDRTGDMPHAALA